MKPLATITLPNPQVDFYTEHLVSRLPDGTEAPAVPIRGNTRFGCFAHEVAHHIAAQVLWQGPSKCLERGGARRDWTEDTRAEEALAMALGPQLEALMLAAQNLPRDRRKWFGKRSLTAEKVRQLRAEFTAGHPRGAKGIAEAHGLSPTVVWNAVHGITYQEVK